MGVCCLKFPCVEFSRFEVSWPGEGSDVGVENKGRPLRLRPVGLGKWRGWWFEVRKSHDRRLLRLGANGAGEGSEDGRKIKGDL